MLERETDAQLKEISWGKAMTAKEASQHLGIGGQILKTRDDPAPIFLDRDDDAPNPDRPSFKLAKPMAGTTSSWAKLDETFGSEKLRSRIEPWLKALVQSELLSLLVGSGLTHAAHHLATGTSLPGLEPIRFPVLQEEIATQARRAAELAGRDSGNFEDQIRAANDLLRGMEILGSTKAENAQEHEQIKILRKGLKDALGSFAASILEGERSLASAAAEKREEAFNYLVSFLMSFASRSGTRERLHLFTTNYDRYIEAGAEAAGPRLVDRFVGSLAPVFRASRLDVDLHYNPPGIRGEPRFLEGVARFTKLHGSVDWVDSGRAIRRIGLPFGAKTPNPYLAAPGLAGANARRLMIYPNSAKDRETAAHPCVELFRDLAAAICRWSRSSRTNLGPSPGICVAAGVVQHFK